MRSESVFFLNFLNPNPLWIQKNSLVSALISLLPQLCRPYPVQRNETSLTSQQKKTMQAKADGEVTKIAFVSAVIFAMFDIQVLIKNPKNCFSYIASLNLVMVNSLAQW